MGGMVAKDQGTRAINVLNSKWTRMPMQHRVMENMKQPLISAGETVDYGNLVFMSPEVSFVSPIDSDFGWHLNQAIKRLARRFGTHRNLPLHRNASNVFVFDGGWIESPPRPLHSMGRKSEAGQPPKKAQEQKKEDKEDKKKTVGIKVEPEINEFHSDSESSEATRTINEDEHEDPYEGKLRNGEKGKKTNTKDQAKLSDKIYTQPPYQPGFGRLVPKWP